MAHLKKTGHKTAPEHTDMEFQGCRERESNFNI